jgi:hypothetical protein
MKDYSQPDTVDDVTLAFPARLGDLLPPYAELPDEFRRHNGTTWNTLVSEMFFSGGKWPRVKDGINPVAAKRHVGAVLRSFEPKHEHKEAGAAYLMSLWFELPVGDSGESHAPEWIERGASSPASPTAGQE